MSRSLLEVLTEIVVGLENSTLSPNAVCTSVAHSSYQEVISVSILPLLSLLQTRGTTLVATSRSRLDNQCQQADGDVPFVRYLVPPSHRSDLY